MACKSIVKYYLAMIYFICAHLPEAKALITHYSLKRSAELPWPFYTSDEATLIVSGSGIHNAMIASGVLFGARPPGIHDVLINVGICGAPERFDISSLLIAHKLVYGDTSRYPDILFSHPFEECSVRCVDSPQDTVLDTPVDMESFGIFLAAERFFDAHLMVFVKVVSDHFNPQNVSASNASLLIEHHVIGIIDVIDRIVSLQTPALFDETENRRLQLIATHLTKSQFQRLIDACSHYKLTHAASLPQWIDMPQGLHQKNQRKEWLDTLCLRLIQ